MPHGGTTCLGRGTQNMGRGCTRLEGTSPMCRLGAYAVRTYVLFSRHSSEPLTAITAVAGLVLGCGGVGHFGRELQHKELAGASMLVDFTVRLDVECARSVPRGAVQLTPLQTRILLELLRGEHAAPQGSPLGTPGR